MDKLKELRQERAAFIKEARLLVDKAADEKRDLNDDEQAKYDEYMAKVDSRDFAIAREERLMGLEAGLEEPATRAVKNDPAPQEKSEFRSFGEQLAAVIRASQGRRDPRLAIADAEGRAATGLGETVAADGGFLVQQDFSSDLLKRAYQTGALASRVNRIPVSANSNGLKMNAIAETTRVTGSRYGGIQVYWAAEADTVTATKPKFRQMELSLKKLMGLCYLTDELVQDSAALESVVTQAFAEEFGFILDDAIFQGSGSGQPLGFMNCGCKVSVTRNTGSHVKFADIVNMYSRLWAPSRSKAVWVINQDVEPDLFSMTLGDYAPAYMPPGGLSGAQYGTIFGRPVIAIEQCQTLGTAGDIALMDLSQYVMIEKGGVNTASSVHVKFLYDEAVLRFTYRCDGQPVWNSTLTPYKGSNTQSPFIVLT